MFTRRLLLKSLVCLALVLGSVGAYAQPFRPHEPLDPSKAQSLPLTPMDIEAGGKVHHFKVEVAQTQEEQHIGLMHRTELAADRGMLFPYEVPEVLKFWMRNTFIPLDMLFMRDDGVITYIAENVQAHDERPVGPDTPVSAQLELPAGTVARLGIKVGDTVHHTIFGN
ncbi:MAG: DUF192 domain-containing protein [Rhodospirillaceae bacterium]|nr:MAG: DUF192 domain-containing protein [Rhodospirillaceae bacterium]